MKKIYSFIMLMAFAALSLPNPAFAQGAAPAGLATSRVVEDGGTGSIQRYNANRKFTAHTYCFPS